MIRLTVRPRFPIIHLLVGAWLSLVERSVRDREVGGSNPLAPTNNLTHINGLEIYHRQSYLLHVANLWTKFPTPELLPTVEHGYNM